MTQDKQNSGGGGAKLTNPLSGIENTNIPTIKAGFLVSREDHMILRRIKPDQGVVQAALTQIYYKLINEIKRRNLTDYTDYPEFENFVMRSKLCLPGEQCQAGGPEDDPDGAAGIYDRGSASATATGGSPTANPLSSPQAPNVGGGIASGSLPSTQPARQSPSVLRSGESVRKARAERDRGKQQQQ
jgi:hypothetical protein